MEFYLAIKKNEILLFASKWMELENIILSEVSQVQKDKVECFLSHVKDRPNTYTSNIMYTYRERVSKSGIIRALEETKEGGKEEKKKKKG
jgi:hypothetical protein